MSELRHCGSLLRCGRLAIVAYGRGGGDGAGLDSRADDTSMTGLNRTSNHAGAAPQRKPARKTRKHLFSAAPCSRSQEGPPHVLRQRPGAHARRASSRSPTESDDLSVPSREEFLSRHSGPELDLFGSPGFDDRAEAHDIGKRSVVMGPDLGS